LICKIGLLGTRRNCILEIRYQFLVKNYFQFILTFLFLQ